MSAAEIAIPELSLVVLIGASGSGKSTFARRHFRPTEVLSSDFCRAIVADDENDQSATQVAFEVLHVIADKRLAGGRLTVIDATNVQPEARRPLVALARQNHCLPVAIVFDLPESICQRRNSERTDRSLSPHVIRRQLRELRRSLRGLRREGFRYIYLLSSVDEIEAATVRRVPLWTNRQHEHGPFDVIGDVHGCFDELAELLGSLGYVIAGATADDGERRFVVQPPDGRKAIFVGDLVDRGPHVPDTLRLVMDMVEADIALCVPGNHDVKLLRKLNGRDVRVSHGLAETLEQLEREPASFLQRVRGFLDGLISHYVLDDGRLVVAHAGMKHELQGRSSAKVRDFALYGETTGEIDDFDLPVRLDWARDYRGKALVVYGHTPVATPEWLNNTINIDTGCVFGGALTALRYPEKEIVSVRAKRTYAASPRPFLPPEAPSPALSIQQRSDDLLRIDDVLGRRTIETRLMPRITLQEGQTAAALEVMSRFAANPRWLIYLPPTMSPSETSQLDGLLEHPAEAFAYYRSQGVSTVVCQEKHMGSRAVIIVCRDEEVARWRFGVDGEGGGICYTRTGRRFFEDPVLEAQLIECLRAAMDRTGFWEEFQTDWACFDCELMPWSLKAQELLRRQYAPVGTAGRAALAEVQATLAATLERDTTAVPLFEAFSSRAELVERFAAAYRHYCWPVESVADVRLAPFHLLATDGTVHGNRDHAWHMETIARLCTVDEVLVATPYRLVNLDDASSQQAAIEWWTELTARGGEGFVVKPLDLVPTGKRGLIQPAIKCRGPEYLRIIYGPNYSEPANLARLRSRGLSAKRSLALREFALGIEALERFVQGEPLYRVHECVFGVLALESEPVDPRL